MDAKLGKGPVVGIRPLAGLAGIRTIEAIRALRVEGAMDLLKAKRTVEAMIENGSAVLDYALPAGAGDDPGLVAQGMVLRDALGRHGVMLTVDGAPFEGPGPGPSTP